MAAMQVYREFETDSSIYDFKVHKSNDYLIILTELGRIYIYNIHLSQFCGYIEVQLGSLKLSQDPTGLYLAVSSPNKAITVD